MKSSKTTKWRRPSSRASKAGSKDFKWSYIGSTWNRFVKSNTGRDGFSWSGSGSGTRIYSDRINFRVKK